MKLSNRIWNVGDEVDVQEVITETEGGTIFTIEQQVNDYIEKSKYTDKNKKRIISEIEKYKILLEEYTDLESGIRIKKIPNNQLLYSIFGLNPKIVNLFSSYLHKELYYNAEKVGNYELDSIYTEVSKWQYSVIEKQYKSSPEDFSNETYEKNIMTVKNKLQDYHKKIRLETDQKIAIVNKIFDSKNNPFFFAIGKEGELKVVPYDMVPMDKGDKVILNGIIFRKLSSLHKEINYHKSSNLLSKSLQNLENSYEKLPKIRMLTDDLMKEQKYFHENLLTFYEFQKDKTFKEYIEDLDFGLKEISDQIFDRKEISIYQCLKKLSLFDISKLNTSEYLFIQKFVRENISSIKKNINLQRNDFIRMNRGQNEYVYVPYEIMYEVIVNSYLSKEMSNNSKIVNSEYQMGELLTIAGIDNMELLLFEMKMLNKENNIDFNDEEVNNYILELEAKLNGEISKNNNENKVEYSKYYKKKDEMLRDKNKIILKNINKNENGEIEQYDPFQYLYETLISNITYTGNINEFVIDLDKLLNVMHEENPIYAEFEEPFKNNSEQEDILKILVNIIQNKQVRKDDICYVEEEKKFYIYDGLEWTDAEKFNSSLSKEFIQVKNSIDEFEDINKIVNDSLLKYIQKMK